ncbi:Arsenical pump-driving ATPase [Nocardia otitidiscaviarum]|uniref:Arsenical pump-driving ATPase n=1 Tax=Nocardia otitidiscaviarum TaxID=1823 RepID=A0A379JJB7_9NOCA|nr:ArsA family ATPase [Nocardia otitidiscaviarum]SUD48083.1 Arsenical pump-driving ATPase [Nocardia otitidiscaviarum]
MELFVGKGGVGKTTLACATAMAYARAGQRVLLASLDQAHSLGDALGVRIAHDPGTVPGVQTVRPGLDVIEVDSLALLEDRFREVLRMLSGAGHDHGIDIGALDPAELTGLPGVQELLALLEIAQFVADEDWDVVVVDCPPSADMLRIVTAPDTLLGYLERVWPAHTRTLSAIGADLRRAVLATTVERIAAAVSGVRDLLADRTRTGARLVTAAERVAVAESTRVRSAAVLLGLRLDAILVNKVLPPMPPVETRELPDAGSLAGPAHPAVQWYFNRRAEQLEVVAELRRRVDPTPVVVVGHTGAEPVGLSALSAMSFDVDASGGWVGSEPVPMLGSEVDGVPAVTGEPMVRLESGAGVRSVYAMRMHLPVVDPSTLRLGRVEDDLIVGADGVRRRLRLAPVLRRCTVENAELEGEHLIVRFRPDPQVWPI